MTVSEKTIKTSTGVSLRTIEFQADSELDSLKLAQPLVLLHGFTGSAETMAPLAKTQPGRKVVCIDTVGHGKSDSPEDPGAYSFESCRLQLSETIDALELGACHLLGYSMGGRIALDLVHHSPISTKVLSLTLISSTAGLKDAQARADRIKADQELADSINEKGLEDFIDKWMSQPLFSSQSQIGKKALAQTRKQRLRNNPIGLIHCLMGLGLGQMESYWSQLKNLDLKCLLISGEYDQKFTQLAIEMQALLPQAIALKISGVGHAPQSESPETTGLFIRSYLSQLERNYAF